MQELEGAAGNAKVPGIWKMWSCDVLHLASCLESVIFAPFVPTGRGKLWPRDLFCFQVEILAL